MSDSTAVVRELYDAVNSHDLERLLAVLAVDYVEHEEVPIPPGDSDRVRATQMFGQAFGAFPDFRIVVDDTITEGDKVACRLRVTGTHQGEFMGIPATGRSVEFSVIDVQRVADGRVVEHWGVSDVMGLMQQLGVAPA